MMPPHDRITRLTIVSCVLVTFIACSNITAAVAQVLPPLNNPPPGSTLTTTTVTFTGDDAGQAGEQHWLSVETSPYAKDIFNESLGTGHTATVSGLPTTGTLYVRYHTYTPIAGWNAQSHTYTMNLNVDGGGTTGGGGNSGANADNPTIRWDRILNASNGDAQGCNSDRFKCVLGGAAVLDLETGLVWDRGPDSNTTRMWTDAIDHCARRKVTGRLGWSLPMFEQLASLLDTSATRNNLPDGNPFFSGNGFFHWTATTDPSFPTLARAINFLDGSIDSASKKQNVGLAWCVRGGQVFDGNVTAPTLP